MSGDVLTPDEAGVLAAEQEPPLTDEEVAAIVPVLARILRPAREDDAA